MFILNALGPLLAAISVVGSRVEIPDCGFDLRLEAALPPWEKVLPQGGFSPEEDGTRRFSFVGSSSNPFAPITVVERLSKPEDGGIRMDCRFSTTGDVVLAALGIFSDLKLSEWPRLAFVCDGHTVAFPEDPSVAVFHDRPLTNLSVVAEGRRLDYRFDESVRVFLQSGRRWRQESVSVRFLAPETRPFRGGETWRVAFTLKGVGDYEELVRRPMTIDAGRDWIPLTIKTGIRPGSALDFSSVPDSGKPAGKFGRLVAKGSHFEFEHHPGVPQRFYGVNLCGTAVVPSPEQSRQLAELLSRMGYNAVRIHHHEEPLSDRRADDPGRVCLDEEAMRKFDALVAACVDNGLYLTTDLFVSRTGCGIPWRTVGVDREGCLSMRDFKRMVYVHEGVASNFFAHARNFLGHRNALTGRTLAREPALAWISLVNEGNIDRFGRDLLSYPEWKAAWNEWLARGNRDDAKAFERFLGDVQRRFTRRVRAFLRDELGCTALVTDANNPDDNVGTLAAVRAEEFDYVDVHFYVDHPEFLSGEWRLPSRCPQKNPFLGEGFLPKRGDGVRVRERPFVVTEYNFCAPGRYRGAGGLAIGAEAACSDWSAAWRFAWAHASSGLEPAGNKAVNFFNVAADPLALASERACIALFLRGDLAAGNRQAVRVDRARGELVVETSCTCGGFSERGTIRAGCVLAQTDQVPTTLWASSLDGRPLLTSRRILVTHLTDVQSAGARFGDEDFRMLLAWGWMPYLMRQATARVSVRCAPGRWTVHALETDGTRRRVVSSRQEGGNLTFDAQVGVAGETATFLYELVRAEEDE